MISSFCRIAALAASILPGIVHASIIVNIDALNAGGSTVTLGPGNYSVSVIGTAQGGEFNGWDFAATNYGKPNQSPAPGDWTDSFYMTAGGAKTYYDIAGNQTFGSALSALAGYQQGDLYANGSNLASSTPDTVKFSLFNTQTVNFTVFDQPCSFDDNSGGISLQVSQIVPQSTSNTPEPATVTTITAATGLACCYLYIRRKLGSR